MVDRYPGAQSGDRPYTDGNFSSTNPNIVNSDSSYNPQLMHQVEELTRTNAANAQHAIHEADRLRSQVRWLVAGLVIAVVGLGGAIAGVFFGLRDQQATIETQQDLLAEQVETLDEAQGSAEQLSQVEEQLQALNQRAEAIGQQAQSLIQQTEVSPSQLESIQQQLESLESSIQENVSDSSILGRINDLRNSIPGTEARPNAGAGSAPEAQPDQPPQS